METEQQLSAFETALARYAAGQAPKGAPDRRLQDLWRRVIAWYESEDPRVASFLRRNCDMLVQGRDAWGRVFRYDVDRDAGVVAVWSVGNNGDDEHGGGDDICRRVRFQRRPGRKGQGEGSADGDQP